MSHDDFSGWLCRRLDLPEGDSVVCYYYRNDKKNVSLYDINHNIFRLDKEGRVIWQVTRDERGKLNLEEWNEHALARGDEEWREPFTSFGLIFPDGRRESADIMRWRPGCIVSVSSCSGQDYELDVDKGVIVNVTPHRQRPW